MFRFIALMIVPLGICIYTFSFGRWLYRRDIIAGSIAAYILAVLATALAGYVFWRYTVV